MIKKGSGVLIALVILLLGLFFLNFHPRSHSSTEKNSYKTVAAEKPLVHFAVIGDYGLSGTPEKDVSQLVKSWQPEFVITVGDNNYPNGEKSSFKENVLQYYGEYINSDFSKTRFFPTLGNHDWMVPNAKGYLESFTLSGKQTYYDFVKGDIHFFVLDSQPDEPDGIEQNSPQAQWLRKGLRTSSQKY